MKAAYLMLAVAALVLCWWASYRLTTVIIDSRVPEYALKPTVVHIEAAGMYEVWSADGDTLMMRQVWK